MMTEYPNRKTHTYGTVEKPRIKGWGKGVKQIYEDSFKLTEAERERLLEGFMRLTVTKEVPPFFGNEREIFERLTDLRDRLWAAYEAEFGKVSPEIQTASPEEISASSDADNNTKNNINNNINNKRKENINISMTDHDHDHRESKIFLEEYRGSHWEGHEEAPQKSAEGDPVANVIAKVEAHCNMTCFDYVRQEIADYVNLLGEEICILAVERAEKFRGGSWGYIRKILKKWYDEGVRTPEQAMAHSKAFDNKKKNYRPHTYRTSTHRYQQTGGSMYCTHNHTGLSDLEREAIRSALMEE